MSSAPGTQTPEFAGGLMRAKTRARAHGKVNLTLLVGARQTDGFHPLRTVFQSLDLREEVTASAADALTLTVAGLQSADVPVDSSNLAARAAMLLAAHWGLAPNVLLAITKGVPVAGGMAGGSADAAATLIALNALWGAVSAPGTESAPGAHLSPNTQMSAKRALTQRELMTIAAQLGADVPFTVLGGTALGVGRGDELQALKSSATFHWALALRDQGLSTPAVYGEFDRISPLRGFDLDRETEMIVALAKGDPVRVGAALRNDLQPAALTLAPELSRSLAAAQEAGALGALVSGSGPTVAALARTAEHAEELAAAFADSGASDRQLVTTSAHAGAHLLPVA